MNDKEYILENIPTATENEIEAFCERVAIFIDYADFNENKAREIALKMLNRYKKLKGEMVS